ncbi:peptidoglycan-binding protein [Streptomyces sp. NPDC094153]|uniref:peptidoglycan-binding protein n=1 Tax=Streptomyces sp. NPDC094153 TaxID=3366058 RepID=UPI0037F73B31
MPGADWRPIPINYTPGGQASVRGVVVHIMDGTLEGTDSWFRSHPEAKASSHFGTSRAGDLRQWVSTSDKAWAQANGNSSWLSVENEGRGGDTLTDAQLDRNAEVLAWAHATDGVPLQVADGPDGRGLGYHAMGGNAWGGHLNCPGSRVVAQLAEIVARAKMLTGDGSAGGGTPSDSVVARYQATIGGLAYGYGAHGDHVTKVGQALVARDFGRHYRVGPSADWSDADTLNYSDYQQSLGLRGTAPHQDADGVPGPTTLKQLLGSLPAAPGPSPAPAPVCPPFPGRDKFVLGAHGDFALQLQRWLDKGGWGPAYKVGPSRTMTALDLQKVAALQRHYLKDLGPADGLTGPRTWQYAWEVANGLRSK